MPDYFRGETISLTANYLDSGSSPINTGISGNTVDVYYYTSSGSKNFYVTSGTMTQDVDYPNRFFYMWQIPATAPVTNYTAQYNALMSGNIIQSTDVFGVSQAVATTGIVVGSVTVSGSIVDISGTGIQNAYVQVADFSSSQIITSTTTNASGVYYVYLDPADYIVVAGASTYLSNSVAKTVPTGMTTYNFGPITLLSSIGTGAVAMSDTYTYVDPNDGLTYGLGNLKVSLFAKVTSPVLTSALAITRTDASGTFNMTANNGEYVLRIEGNGPNNTVFDTAYDIEVSDAFTSGTPLGFRYEGTSQYKFI
jgi:hypothetical protein